MTRYRSAARERELQALLKRDHTLTGCVLCGLDGQPVELQARAVTPLAAPTPWRSAVSISGMARGAISEVMDRISGTFSKLDIPEPEVEILINLAPADLPKQGTWLDVPIAVICLQAAGLLPDLPADAEDRYILLGELGLHGEIRRVPGALSMCFAANAGQTLVVPEENERECALVTANPDHKGCTVVSVSTFADVMDFFAGRRRLESVRSKHLKFEGIIPRHLDFSRIRGQQKAKDAAVISAAGGHNLLLIGPPGEGKSLLAGALPGILPELRTEEIVQLTRIYSACGMLERDGLAVTKRPMRAVHHTASKQSLVGGGAGIPRPGEVTLAHLGVLFLDEFAEFPRGNIEALRQPIESGEISIARVGGTLTFPCRFTLLAAMNPCPCGYYGTESCRCTAADVKKYLSKISGPIVDRVDLQVEMARLTTEERFVETQDGESAALRQRVELARQRQARRYAGTSVPFNAAMPGGHVRDYTAFSQAGFDHYKQTIDANRLSTRSMDRLAKVARTVADLEEADAVEPAHIDRAASFVVGGLLRDSF